MQRLLIVVLLAVGTPALAQALPDASLSLSGHLAHPRGFSAADLASLPSATADAADGSHFTGMLLWPLLNQAGWVDAPGRKTHLQHVILAHGRDGYTVALSIGELDPNFAGKAILVATAHDGKPLKGFELFVPGDSKAGRRVHDLVAIEVQ